MTYKKNQTVYLDNGRVCQFIETLSDGRHVVSPGYSNEAFDEDVGHDEWHYFSGEKVVDQIFAQPPVAARDKEIEQKIEELKAIQSQIDADKQTLRSEQAKNTRLLADLTRYDGLENLAAIMDGKATHVARKNGEGNYQVLTWEAFVKSDKFVGVMTLHFNGHGAMWKAKAEKGWRDERNYHYPSIPCFSEDHAKEELRKLADADLKEAWKEWNKHCGKDGRDPTGKHSYGYEPDRLQDWVIRTVNVVGDDHDIIVAMRNWINRAEEAGNQRRSEAKRIQLEKLRAEVEG